MTQRIRITVLGALLVACGGEVGAPEGQGIYRSQDRGGGTSQPSTDFDVPADCEPSDYSIDAPIRRLTVAEFEVSLASTFPPDALESASSLLSTIPPDTTVHSPGEFEPILTQQFVEDIERVAGVVAGAAVTLEANRQWFGFPCLEDALPTEGCVSDVLTSVGTSLFRRPLSGDELSVYETLYWNPNSRIDAESDRFASTFAAMITDPAHLFVLTPVDSERQLSTATIASRIALLTTGGAPDDALREIANGEGLLALSTRQDEARRLLNTDAGRAHVRRVFQRWLHLDQPVDVSAAARVSEISADGLWNELVTEALDVVEFEVFDQGASYQELMSTRLEAPSTERLANLLDQPQTSNTPIESVSGRVGLLARPALLASKSELSSPILRGLFVLERVMCQTVPAPPADADDIAADALDEIELSTLTSRQRAELATDAPQCAACHDQINAAGFALSYFGPLGQPWVDGERALTAAGEPAGLLPVNSAVEDLLVDDKLFDVDGARELSELIGGSQDGAACGSLQLFRSMHLREPSGEDACRLQRAQAMLSAGDSLLDVLVTFAADASTNVSDASGVVFQ